MTQRDISKDGMRNRLELYTLSNARLWPLVERSERLYRMANRFVINNAAMKIPPRPYAFSTKAPYTSWEALTDRTHAGLHLPPLDWERQTDDDHLGVTLSPVGDFEKNLPPLGDLGPLFARNGQTKPSRKSTLLFPYFVQWFTDGFLRTDQLKWQKTTSNHNIDLCPVYGLTPAITELLRDGKSGRLKSQIIDGEEYPPCYYDGNGEPKAVFKGLLHTVVNPAKPESPWRSAYEKKKKGLFAAGIEIERANVQVGFAMLNVLCLREHNRVARLLERKYPHWNGDRVFHTARNVVIVEIIKIVMEDYINHITPYRFKFFTDPAAANKVRWNRQNWMTLEFSLAYRWHSMMPDRVRFHGTDIPLMESMFDTTLITEHGLGSAFEEASNQPAGHLGLHNTADFLVERVELESVKLGREAKLRRYNDYRELLKFPRATSFEQLSSDEAVVRHLKDLYKNDIDNLEFYVGLYAEDLRINSALPPMVGRLVGIDAFSQALTNPLLAENIFNKETFSPVGWDEIHSVSTLSELVHRNVPDGRTYRVSFQNRDWVPQPTHF